MQQFDKVMLCEDGREPVELREARAETMKAPIEHWVSEDGNASVHEVVDIPTSMLPALSLPNFALPGLDLLAFHYNLRGFMLAVERYCRRLHVIRNCSSVGKSRKGQRKLLRAIDAWWERAIKGDETCF